MSPSASTVELSTMLRRISDSAFLQKLQHLRLAVRYSASNRPGNTTMRHATQASGMELASHKRYAPGDDLRRLDWNAYSRLDQRLIKTFQAEREAPLHILIDTSASMGSPAVDAKFPFAIGLTTSLAYISLRHYDPVQIFAIGAGSTLGQTSFHVRHPRRLPELEAFLLRLKPSGPTTLDTGVNAYARTTRLPSIAILISDFLVPPPVYEASLEQLVARGHRVAAVRLIGTQEREPISLPRRVRLHDVESGVERVVDLSDAHRALYAQAVEEHLRRLQHWCEARAITYLSAETSQDIEVCLLRELPRVGLLQ